ncbi:NUDIX hydrolase [Solilutibacter pythonis]|uniref:NUDIX hydrolase n=1 Tax=Solilutibacter pythonis TaxID=2483112 RepID=UPI0026781BC7
MSPGLADILPALRPLPRPPLDAPWNREGIDDLLPATLREAAVLVGLVTRAEGARILFTRRTEHLRHHGGQVSFPGGAVEPCDAGVVAAALRETREEIGIGDPEVVPLGFLDPMATVTGFRVVPVVARIDPAYRAVPDPGEVAEVFELPLDFVLAPGTLFHQALSWQGRKRRVAELRPWPGAAHPRIWGATAMIVENLRHRLEKSR